MNKMAEVAQLFDKELEEKFTIIDDNGVVIDACFNEAGMDCFLPSGEKAFMVTPNVLRKLLTGAYRIKKTPWKAGYGEQYYLPRLHPTDKVFFVEKNICTAISDDWYNLGLMCKTQEQAEELAQLLIKTARKFQGFDDEEEA